MVIAMQRARLVLLVVCLILFAGSVLGKLHISCAIPLPLPTQELESRRVQAEQLLRQGDTEYKAGQFNTAIQVWKQALSIYRTIQVRGSVAFNGYAKDSIWLNPGESDALYRLGDAYYSLQDFGQAITYYEAYLSLMKERQNSQKLIRIGLYSFVAEKEQGMEGEGMALLNIGCALIEAGQLEQAETALQKAMQIWELPKNLGDRELLFAPLQSTYRLLQKVLIAQNKISEALEIVERSRTIDPPTISQIQQIVAAQSATVINYSVIYDTSVEHSIIHHGISGYGGGKEQESDLFIWIIDPSGKIQFTRVDLKPVWQGGNTSFQTLVTNTRGAIGVRGRGSIDIQPLQESYQTQYLRQLDQILMAPISQYLPTAPNAQIIMIPQGLLSLVPFAALQDPNGQYLVEKYTIRMAYSIRTLESAHRQKRPTQRLNGFLIVGNPTMPSDPFEAETIPKKLPALPAAEQEAIAVANLFKTRPLIGKEATKAIVVQQMPSAHIIHLATHGLLDNIVTKNRLLRDAANRISTNIEKSFALFNGHNKSDATEGMLALAPSKKDNGFLTSQEISALNLKAELAVLSACDTGRGYITGTGVVGLSRAFIIAGVPSVIVSLWSVPDAPTAELMVEFYRNWQERKLDKAQALRQAMLTIMKTHPNPKNWAAFTLIGESD